MGSDHSSSRRHGRSLYFNPRSPHGERPHLQRCSRLIPLISIHAPRMGSDCIRRRKRPRTHISIHAPRMGSDLMMRLTSARLMSFQSTLPAWGATSRENGGKRGFIIFQSTLPAWGATGQGLFYSIKSGFQSTLPAWGATFEVTL